MCPLYSVEGWQISTVEGIGKYGYVVCVCVRACVHMFVLVHAGHAQRCNYITRNIRIVFG